MFKDGSCCTVGKIKSGKCLCGVSQDVEETSEGEVEPSQSAEVKAIQLALGTAEREKQTVIYLCGGSWIVANSLMRVLFSSPFIIYSLYIFKAYFLLIFNY